MFASTFKEGAVHQVVNAYIAGSHTGTHAAKTRAETRGGGRKPYRQKGTGRARRGSIRSPLARGGGIIFAPRPFNRRPKNLRGMYRVAMRSLLSKLTEEERVVVVEDFTTQPKTKAALKLLGDYGFKNMNSSTRLLVIIAEQDPNLELAIRNLPHVELRLASKVSPLCLVKYHKFLASVSAVKKLEERLS